MVEFTVVIVTKFTEEPCFHRSSQKSYLYVSFLLHTHVTCNSFFGTLYKFTVLFFQKKEGACKHTAPMYFPDVLLPVFFVCYWL
jgi:hypothetical protein